MSARLVQQAALSIIMVVLTVACDSGADNSITSGGVNNGPDGAETVGTLENGSAGLSPAPDTAGDSAPDKPISFAVLVEPQALEVVFNEVPGATAYRVYYSPASGTTAQSASVAGSQSPIRIEGLTKGTPYYLRLRAFNSTGASALSDERRASTLAPPDILQSINVEPANKGVRVSWNAGQDATAYTVFASTAAGDVNSSKSVQTRLLQASITGLDNGTTYYVSVQAENIQGAAPRTAEVAVTPRADAGGTGWSAQQLINDPVDFYARDIYLGAAAVNDSGVSAVSWRLRPWDDSYSRLYINHTGSDGSWGEETLLSSESGSAANVAVTPDGKIVAVWIGEYTSDYGLEIGSALLSRRYVNGVWTEVETVADIASGRVGSIALAADGENNVVATWEQSGGTIWVNRLTDAGWSVPLLVSDSVRGVSHPLVGTSANNQAIVVWLQDHQPLDLSEPNGGPDETSLHAIEFNGSDWGVARRIGHVNLDGLDSATSLRLDVNAEGSAVAVWRQRKRFEREITGYRIDSVWFDPGSRIWTSPETRFDRDWPVAPDDVSLNSAGDAVMNVRPSIPGDESHPLQVSFFDSQNRTWSSPETIVYRDRPEAWSSAQTEILPNGDAFTVWASSFDVQWRRYDAGVAEWGPAVKLGTEGGAMAFATSSNGHTVVATNTTLVSNRDGFTLAVFALRYLP